jgi:hypothetical protein
MFGVPAPGASAPAPTPGPACCSTVKPYPAAIRPSRATPASTPCASGAGELPGGKDRDIPGESRAARRSHSLRNKITEIVRSGDEHVAELHGVHPDRVAVLAETGARAAEVRQLRATSRSGRQRAGPAGGIQGSPASPGGPRHVERGPGKGQASEGGGPGTALLRGKGDGAPLLQGPAELGIRWLAGVRRKPAGRRANCAVRSRG